MRPTKKNRIDAELEAFEALADDEAEAMAEELIASATSGEGVAEDARNEPGFGEEVDVVYTAADEYED